MTVSSVSLSAAAVWHEFKAEFIKSNETETRTLALMQSWKIFEISMIISDMISCPKTPKLPFSPEIGISNYRICDKLVGKWNFLRLEESLVLSA